MKVIYYKSDKGIYVTNKEHGYNSRALNGKRFNGKEGEATHHKKWVHVPGEDELNTVETLKSGDIINVRWELQEPDDPLVAKLDLPPILSAELACERYDDDDFTYVFGEDSEYRSVQHLYKREYDRAPEYYKAMEVEIECLGEIKSEWIGDPVEDKYTVYKGSRKKELLTLKLTSIAYYSDIDAMMTPELLRHNRPCSISSEQTYKIVRHWVLDHIDHAQAKVTSDYTFCFNVEKKITIKPITVSNEKLKRNGRSYRSPRFTTITKTHKTMDCFTMTSAKDNYKGYTVIEGFKGDNLQSLADNIKQYLEELMKYINLPVTECETCGGTGHHVGSEFKLNKREQR